MAVERYQNSRSNRHITGPRIFRLQYTVLFFLLFHLSLVPQAHCQKSDLEKAKALNQQVVKLYKQGGYAKAIPIAKNVQAILEKAFGPDHPHVATGLNNLALLYVSLGDYGQAEPLYKRALAIKEKSLGPHDPRVATSLNNLAELYRRLGDYAKAEPLYKRALAIREKALGSNNPDVAESLNNLALLYFSLGDYAKAEPLYNRAMAILEKTLGPDHPRVATGLNNSAALYHRLGDYDQAEPLYKRAMAILEKTLGPDHPDVATGLNNLAELYSERGDYAKAEPLYKRVLAIREKALGPDHPGVAIGLNNLAELYRKRGDYDQAEPLYKSALATLKNALGPDHPRVAIALSNLVILYAAQDKIVKAHELNKRVQEIDRHIIENVMGFTSEDQKINFLALKKGDLAGFLTLIDRHLIQSPSARKDALNLWLRRKGIILEAQRRFQEALVYSDDPEAVKTLQELARVRAQLSVLALGGPGKRGLAAYKKRLADLKAQKEQLKTKLIKLSQSFAVSQKIARANCETVARSLPQKSVLLEFARIEMFNFKAKGREKKWQPARYLAFVLHAGQGDRVGMIDLGNAEAIDREVTRFKKEVLDLRDLKATKATETSKIIYRLVFAPLKKELGNAKEIFISPDGNLNLIPFEELQGPDGRYLIEDYTFNYLATGREVLGFGQIEKQGQRVLLMGDPDFDMGSKEKNSALRKLALGEAYQADTAKRSTDMRGIRFSRLPGTREEVMTIQNIMGKDKAVVYTGKKALEGVLRGKEMPSIVHLATHGFFLSDLDFIDLADQTIDQGIAVSPKPIGDKVKVENPLLRSGIALAGANTTLQSRSYEKSDGIVTAEKILGLRLRGTDMVVLSACDTGVGEVKAGEGVFGLRRAFTQAGTRSLVMSMWSVPDTETKELMVEFYKNVQSGRMNHCQALRQAALKEMKIVKERYGYANPLFWGAFVFMGEP
jgi:CHAT domain-containing protein/Tfp pilus assembly protein PilF